jgi:ADP-L-glycero-D-manno-heptose 6-epimerase
MDKASGILLTGAAGFIGSYLLGYLNQHGYTQIVIVDDFSEEDKWFNFEGKEYSHKVHRDDLFSWLEKEEPRIDFVFHLGARTDTTEFDYAVHEKLNLEYSRRIWNYCSRKQVPLVYASSAATYGAGENGYSDDHDLVEKLKPLNPYGVSKNEFDKWALEQSVVGSSKPEVSREPETGSRELALGGAEGSPPYWAGLKFFNVYGPNEYHKERMASMVFHGYNQVKKTGKIKLFRSHRPDFKDGEQLRDFIYVEDVAKVMVWMMRTMVGKEWPVSQNGLYNLGTGQARSFIDLVSPIFKSMNLPVNIEFIDTPEDIRDKYQYFTEAEMKKLRSIGYSDPFTPVEKGVKEYVGDFLSQKRYY